MLQHYISAQFLLSTGVAAYSRGDKFLLLFNAILFILGIIFSVVSSRIKRKNQAASKLIARWSALLITMGVLALFWSLLREQGIVLLSAHIIILLIYICALIWVYYVLRYQFTVHKSLAAEQRRLAEKQKYLSR